MDKDILKRLTRPAGSATFTLVAGLAGLVFAFLPALPYRPFQYDLPKEVALGVLGGVAALQLLASSERNRADLLAITLVAFLGWGLVAVTSVSDNAALGRRTVGLFAAGAAVFFLARRAGRIGEGSAILDGAVVIMAAMCAVVLLEAYGGIPLLSPPGLGPGATLGNRNLAARTACLALPLLWVRLFTRGRKRIRFALLAVVSAVMTVIVISRSRNALLVAGALALLLPAITWWRAPAHTPLPWRTAAVGWVAALMVGSAAAALLPNRLGWGPRDFIASARRVTEYGTGTGQGRLIQAATTWRMIRAHPWWGVGPGNWSVIYPAYAYWDDPSVNREAFDPAPRIPRNDLLPLIAEWGATGAGIGMLFLVVFWLRTVRLLASPHPAARLHGVLVVGIGLGAAMLGLFDSVFRVAPTLVLLALLAGVALGAGEAEARLSPAETMPRGISAWPAVWAGLVVLCIGFAHTSTQDLEAYRIVDSVKSLKDLERAVRVAPNNVEARALLSSVLVSAGRCDLARSHLERAAHLQPFSLFFRRLEARCARSEQVRRGGTGTRFGGSASTARQQSSENRAVTSFRPKTVGCADVRSVTQCRTSNGEHARERFLQ